MNFSKDDTPIDNDLFKFYSQYKLCKIEKSNDFSKSEKAAIITILKNFQFVEGNIVRSIMNEAFEHSFADSSLPIDNKADTAAHDGPSNTSSTKSVANMIDLTLDGESSRNRSPKPTYATPAHKVFSSSEGSSDSTSDFELGGLDSDTGSFSRKRKYASFKEDKGKERAVEVDMQGILSKGALIRLGNIVRHVEHSKRTLQERLKTVNASFDIHTPSPNDTSTYGAEMFSINRHFDRKSRLNQSQEHLAAYKIGKLIERDRKLFSEDIVHKNMKRYYQSLIKKLKFYSHSEKQDFVYFSIYCRRVIRLVEKIGLYTIFIPEILPPSRIKMTSPDNFEKIENYLNQRCVCFKNIAHYDEDGALKVENNKDDKAKDGGQSSSSTSR